jgi:hypothetical protein
MHLGAKRWVGSEENPGQDRPDEVFIVESTFCSGVERP